jgi:hypothetical protein
MSVKNRRENRVRGDGERTAKKGPRRKNKTNRRDKKKARKTKTMRNIINGFIGSFMTIVHPCKNAYG